MFEQGLILLDAAPSFVLASNIATTIILGVLVVIGAGMCFFGYPLLRLALGLGGFVLGGSIAAYLAWRFTSSPEVIEAVTSYPEVAEEVLASLDRTAVVVWAVCGGIAGAVLCVLLERVGVFALGGMLGLLLANTTMSSFSLEAYLVAVALLVLIGGLLALLLRRTVLILSTAFNGAAALMFGVYALIKELGPSQAIGELRAFGQDTYVLIACTIILGTIGSFIQFLLFSDRRADGKKKG